MKTLFTVLLGLALAIITDLFFEYVISGDYIHIYLTPVAITIFIMLWVAFIFRVYKQINKHFKTKKP